MDYLTFNNYDVKYKNKWCSQLIQKKYKNRHHYRYRDFNKKQCKKQNRIQMKNSSNIINYNIKTKSLKNTQNKMSTKNYYKISVDISLKKNDKNQLINLPDSEYKIIKYRLQNATLNVYDPKQKINYLSYSFVPCNTYYAKGNNDILYQIQNDLYIPLFFDKYNKIKHNLIDTFDNNTFININKPFIEIAQKCLDDRNPSVYNQYSMPYNWNISNINQINDNYNNVVITVNNTILTENENDSKCFIKSRPFSKKDMNSLNIFDSFLQKKLNCNLSKNNVYLNIPILFKQNAFSLTSLAFDENNKKISDIYNKFEATLVSEEKKEKTETQTNEYWFCISCFIMNEITNTTNTKISNYQCIKCNTETSDKSIKFYYKEYTESNEYNYIDVPLTNNESKAINYISNYSKKAANSSKISLLNKIKKVKVNRNEKEIYHKLLDFMANKIPLIIHIKAQELIPKLLKDTHYRNLFEIGSGNGCNNKDTRTMHENQMFPNIYNNANDTEKPKYGCLNIGLQSNGCIRATQYGHAYFTLNNDSIRWRVSYTNKDSFAANGKLATLKNCQHLLSCLNDDEFDELIQTAINKKQSDHKQTTYREIQIHGPVLLKRDIKSLHVPKTQQMHSYIYQQFAQKNSCKLIWF